ncbi:MAG: ribosomal protein S18-alanine N-acetyltransferase [Actinobacteria bacterium]|nr:ribosomal protein S18-alanine N-acetyltransferase [Actinomycetota bacterium]MBO0785021.1 ribosomal protein S18-alanine N-acetyltransferase [Actinomycetota bacterium]
MTTADLPAVAGLEAELFGDEAWSLETLLAELTELPGRFYLVAADVPAPGGHAANPADAPGPRWPHARPQAGTVIGYAGLLVPGGDQADVLTIGVARRRWGEGIGSMLLEALLSEAVLRGCREVFLEVRVDNKRAQRLYRRRGFSEVGLRRGYYQPSGADALVMRLETGPPARPGASRPGPGGRAVTGGAWPGQGAQAGQAWPC